MYVSGSFVKEYISWRIMCEDFRNRRAQLIKKQCKVKITIVCFHSVGFL